MPDGLGMGMGMGIPSWFCLHLACIKPLGSSQNYASIRRDEIGALEKAEYSAEQTHFHSEGTNKNSST